ncbi:hypothetical protein [Streptomyces sp. C10-9-1]|uniref:hypothetical protein n=1 Tax=Streptomyces sp. C10-9-1 TaxID=1859285 RepID=UPI003F49CF92
MATAPATTPSDRDPRDPAPLLGTWLTRGREGLLTACTPGEDAVRRWTQKGNGWKGPDLLPAPGVRAPLTVAQGADNYIHLLGTRLTPAGQVELVHAVQLQTGRPLLGWTALGYPNKTDRRTGDPVAAVDGEGRLCVALRNRGSGVSVRCQQTRGGWARWQDLGGVGTRDTLAAAVDGTGLVELFVPDATSIGRYTQEKPGAAFALAERLETAVGSGSFAALASADGTVSLFFPDEEGMIHVWAPHRGRDPRPLLKAAGPGPLVPARLLVDGRDCTVLAQETGGGEVAFAVLPSEDEGEDEGAGAGWTPTAPGAGRGLALALREHRDGGLVAMALPPGGEPLAARQTTGEGGPAFGRWEPLG